MNNHWAVLTAPGVKGVATHMIPEKAQKHFIRDTKLLGTCNGMVPVLNIAKIDRNWYALQTSKHLLRECAAV